MSAIQEEEFKSSFDIKIWGKMLPFFKKFKKPLIWVITTSIICAAADVTFPLFQKYAIDNFIANESTDGIGGFVAAYLGIVILQGIAAMAFTRLAIRIEMRFGRDLKRACFVHLQELSFSYYNKTPVGYIVSRVMSDTERIGGFVAWGLVDLSWGTLYIIISFITMMTINPQMTLIVLVVVPFIAFVTWFFQSRILKVTREVRKQNSRLTGAYNEGIGGARTSKTLVLEDMNTGEFKGTSSDMYRESMRLARLSALFGPLVTCIGAVATALVLWRGGILVREDLIAFGTLSVFASYAVGIFEPIQSVTRIFADFVSIQANIERVCGLLEREPEVVDKPEVIKKYGDCFHPKKENWEEIRGDIEFKNVTFRYSDGYEDVLENFNLKVPAGTMVAIVGETGAGKSTLVNLACRFFEPTKGEILIDGVDYRERSQLWLHSNIGYVLQTPHLFSGTIRENIRYGRLDATEEEIQAAAKLVSVDDVAARMPGGFDSDVGENGDMLSMGEKQLVSFARAVISDPKIFVLDEATSSIDTETEQLIQDAIATLMEGRTSFIIAHRLSTIRKADVILVVDNGKIVEQGTHKELLKKKGHYYNLYTNLVIGESYGD